MDHIWICNKNIRWINCNSGILSKVSFVSDQINSISSPKISMICVQGNVSSGPKFTLSVMDFEYRLWTNLFNKLFLKY